MTQTTDPQTATGLQGTISTRSATATPISDHTRPAALILMNPDLVDSVWGAAELQELHKLARVLALPHQSLPEPGTLDLDAVEILITGWGTDTLDEKLLGRLPALKAVFHAAGTIRAITTPAFWSRGIPIVPALDANTRPTAEFASAEIVYALKKGWQARLHLKKTRNWWTPGVDVPGLHESVVGLVSLGRIGRYVAERLNLIGGIRVLVFDPYLSAEEAERHGVELASLEELFTHSDVVSIHTPWLPETEGLITEPLLRRLKPGATIINTARGAVIDQNALIRVLHDRTDVFAALDVTHPEPPEPDSPLFEMDNVILTPHIAGSTGTERKLLARAALHQLSRFLQGDVVEGVDASERPLPSAPARLVRDPITER